MTGFFRAKRRQFERSRLRKELARTRGDDDGGTLREFVYLDDVSLYSLFTSRIGPLAETYTELQADALRSSVEASAAAGTDLVAKASIRAAMEGTRTSSREVLRQATVQSTFRDFRTHVDSSVIPAAGTAQTTAAPRAAAELVTTAPDGVWAIGAEAFKRGALVEFDVTLQAQDSYAIAAVADAVGGAVRTMGGLAENSIEVLDQADQVSALIRELLVGLVPLEGELTDWVAVEVGGEWRLVRRSWVDGLSDKDTVATTPVRLAGMAEYPLFWRDIRRVAFADQQFRVLGRVVRAGVSPSWNPLKIGDVLARLGADTIDLDLSAALRRSRNASAAAEEPGQADRAAAHEFVRWVRKALGEDAPSGEVIAEVDAMAVAGPWDTPDEQRETFERILAVAVPEAPRVDRELVADARRAALAHRAELMSLRIAGPSEPDPAPALYVEVEFIAIYW